MTLGGRAFCLFVCLLSLTAGQQDRDASLDPVAVCEAAANWKDYRGKTLALLGRYSFREGGSHKGRWMDQESCGERNEPGMVRLVVDATAAPKPPDPIVIDEPALAAKLAGVRQRTALGKFRFGSADYDRWAVVIGRFDQAAGQELQLVYRGDGAVLFLAER